jgi:hypothetical protein
LAGLENLHVPIVFILGNVLGLDEWHLPICYQNPPFSWKNACTKSGMCCFSVVPESETQDHPVGFANRQIYVEYKRKT